MCIIHTEERSSRRHEHILSYLLPPTGLHFLQQSTSCLWSIKLQSMDWYSLAQRHYYLNVSAVASHLCYTCAFTVHMVLGLIKMTTRRSHHKSPHTDKGNNVLDSLVNYNKGFVCFQCWQKRWFSERNMDKLASWVLAYHLLLYFSRWLFPPPHSSQLVKDKTCQLLLSWLNDVRVLSEQPAHNETLSDE